MLACAGPMESTQHGIMDCRAVSKKFFFFFFFLECLITKYPGGGSIS